MARLHEFEGKAILARHGVAVPRGGVARTPEQATQAAAALKGPSVIKMQAWTTSRAAQGGIAFANGPAEAAAHAARMLALKVGQFPVEAVLVEEKLEIAGELFVSISIDERERSPIVLLAAGGGSGIESRAKDVQRIPCNVQSGPDKAVLARAIDVVCSETTSMLKASIYDLIQRLFQIARSVEARSLEINPLAITKDGKLIAADCRLTIDDYAVFRHPDLGIEIARELDHPPTELERIAYRVEQEDHRGTFFFAQLNTASAQGSKGLIGFHGAGGGGSMMSMDAITTEGFTLANFCDTSGNPSPAKVYRAARIILSQPGLTGYFGSGSGVANQEQFWSAYGLAKAFWEMNLDIPAVIRLGGNTEDRAVQILQSACKDLPARVEGYKKTDPPAKIAARFAELVRATGFGSEKPVPSVNGATWTPRAPRRPAFVGAPAAISFPLKSGRLWLDSSTWKSHAPAIIARASGLLRDDHGKPNITIKPEELLAKDSDLIACEVECRHDGIEGVFVELEISGLS